MCIVAFTIKIAKPKCMLRNYWRRRHGIHSILRHLYMYTLCPCFMHWLLNCTARRHACTEGAMQPSKLGKCINVMQILPHVMPAGVVVFITFARRLACSRSMSRACNADSFEHLDVKRSRHPQTRSARPRNHTNRNASATVQNSRTGFKKNLKIHLEILYFWQAGAEIIFKTYLKELHAREMLQQQKSQIGPPWLSCSGSNFCCRKYTGLKPQQGGGGQVQGGQQLYLHTYIYTYVYVYYYRCVYKSISKHNRFQSR